MTEAQETGITQEDRQRLQAFLDENQKCAGKKGSSNLDRFRSRYLEEVVAAVEELHESGRAWVPAADVADLMDDDQGRVAQALGQLARDGELERMFGGHRWRYHPDGGDS